MTNTNANVLTIAPAITPQSSLTFCEFINTSKVLLKWSLYGASGYMCYYLGMNVAYDVIYSAVTHL